MPKAVWICAAAAWILGSAQASGADPREALARRAAAAAARADADARLTVRVSALRTSEAVTVSAMSARWPDVAVGLGMFLQEQVDAAGALHAPDGTCRVSVALKMDALAAKLRQLIPEAKDKDQPAEAPDGAMMARLNGADAVTVDGLARVSEALLPPPLLPTPRGAANASLAQASNAVGAFWASNATLRGQKLAELLAARRARERLQVVLEELPLRTDMRVRDVLGSAGGPIRKEMATFVKAAAEAGRRYHPNVLLVEVEVAVPVDSFHQALLGWLKLHAPASRLFQRAAEEAIRDRRGDVASACGMAAVPAKHLAGQASGFLGKATQIAGDLPNWLNDTAQAQGAAPAANDPKLVLAAARRDAAAKLNETVLALMVPGRTTLRDFAAGDKEFLASLTALCQVAEPVANLKPFGPDGSARVTVALELEPVWRLMLHHHLKQAPKPDWETGAP